VWSLWVLLVDYFIIQKHIKKEIVNFGLVQGEVIILQRSLLLVSEFIK